MEFMGKTIKTAITFPTDGLDPDTARKLHLIKVTSSPPPAPADAAKRKELAELAAKLDGNYGKAKACTDPKNPKTCRDIGQLSDVMANSRDYNALKTAWEGWHATAIEQRPLYTRFVELANEGTRELGSKDLGELWRAGYDMTPQAFEQETERLWTQVKPLYDQLHCHVRAELAEKYGKDKVPEAGLIPAHLLGNMWAQEWGNIYPLIEPYKGTTSIDVTAALKKAKYDELKMVKLGESFFTSLGLDPLPETFWERSMFTQPKDREVICHASAWDVEANDDLRIKMCIKINQEDLITIHHELGHNYYYHYYYKLPMLYQNGAHDGFHEAIGDALALSVTPVPQADRPHHRGPDRREGFHQFADAGRARQDRVPPVRQADRPVALGRVQRQDHPRPVQRRVVGPARQVPGHRPAERAQGPRLLRRRRQVPRPRERPVHPLLPRADPPVPVPQGPVRRRPATPDRCTSARSTARPPPATRCAPCSPSAPASRGPTPSRPSPAPARWTPSR
jgi:hypothetical protein